MQLAAVSFLHFLLLLWLLRAKSSLFLLTYPQWVSHAQTPKSKHLKKEEFIGTYSFRRLVRVHDYHNKGVWWQEGILLECMAESLHLDTQPQCREANWGWHEIWKSPSLPPVTLIILKQDHAPDPSQTVHQLWTRHSCASEDILIQTTLFELDCIPMLIFID